MAEKALIPLFPLGLVIYPNIALPLHIFEPRYRDLVHYCLENNQEFGVVLHDGEKLHTIGCTCRIIEVLKKYSDGRMDILTLGSKRFEIKDFDDLETYMRAEVVFVDEVEGEQALKKVVKEQAQDFLRQIFQASSRDYDDVGLKKLSGRELSYLIAARGGFSAREKQELLEITTTVDRVARELALRETVMQRVNVNKKMGQLVQKNGKMPKASGNGEMKS